MSFCVLMYVFKTPGNIKCNLDLYDPRKWGVGYKQDRKYIHKIFSKFSKILKIYKHQVHTYSDDQYSIDQSVDA